MANNITIAARFGGVALADNKSHKHRMEIPNSNGTRMYVVAMNNRGGADQGRFECSCPGWIRHRRCKHLKAMLPNLMQLEGAKPGQIGF